MKDFLESIKARDPAAKSILSIILTYPGIKAVFFHNISHFFYVAGFEQSYAIDHSLFGFDSKMDIGGRIYFERFIDDKQKGFEPDSRKGVYFLEEDSTIVGQSHHYETTAFSGFLSESIEMGNLTIRPGVRFELFEQERIDRLAGSTYLDRTTYVLLPGLGFINQFQSMSLFGGIHRGFTPPSSGALKILNFGENSTDEGGLDIQAEKSWNKEIGLRGSLAILNFELSGFHVDIENLDSLQSTPRIVNWYVCEGVKLANTCINTATESGYIDINPLLPGENDTFYSGTEFYPNGFNSTLTVLFQFDQFDFNPGNDILSIQINSTREFTDLSVEAGEDIISA